MKKISYAQTCSWQLGGRYFFSCIRFPILDEMLKGPCTTTLDEVLTILKNFENEKTEVLFFKRETNFNSR